MPKLSHEKAVEQHKRIEQPTKAEKDQALTVRKSNQLIQRNRFELSLREQRLLLYCISKIKPSDHGKETYTIKVRDVCKACGIESNITGGAYKAVIEAFKKLDSFNFILKDEHGTRHIVHWIRDVKIDPEEKHSAQASFTFDPKIVPYLFDVRKYFTQYQIGGVLQMKSVYGVRLYELLKSYANIRGKRFTLDELRYLLGAENKSYDRYSNFKQKILDSAIRDIETFSELKVTYIENRNGRRVEALEFIVTDISGTVEYYERQGFTFDD